MGGKVSKARRPCRNLALHLLTLPLAACVCAGATCRAQLLAGEPSSVPAAPELAKDDLPEAPSALLAQIAGNQAGPPALPPPQSALNRGRLPPCHQPPDPSQSGARVQQNAQGRTEQTAQHTAIPCQDENPLQSVVTQQGIKPLTPHEKGTLAIRDVIDPFNLITIIGYSGIEIAANAHSAYGPGFAGWGRLTGYAFAEDVQGEFFGTYLIPSLVHEDPRYHRMPEAPFKTRLLHAVSHTVISRHDDGRPMPNYATLGTYPISALLSNAYVPGIASSPAETTQRIALGLATDPAGAIIAEFLPDIAKRIHVRVVFVQEIINQIATQSTGPSIQ